MRIQCPVCWQGGFKNAAVSERGFVNIRVCGRCSLIEQNRKKEGSADAGLSLIPAAS